MDWAWWTRGYMGTGMGSPLELVIFLMIAFFLCLVFVGYIMLFVRSEEEHRRRIAEILSRKYGLW
jgi:uncharacterized membrane protein